MAGKNYAGICHVAGAEKLSRWQIGQLLAKRWPGLNAKIEPASARDFPGPARAPDTSLDISKAQRILSAPLPGLGEWLAANPNEVLLNHKVTKTQRKKTLRLCVLVVNYFAFNSKTVMEYGGNERVKSVPNPSTFSVTGTMFVGSSIEFVSEGLFPFKTTAWP